MQTRWLTIVCLVWIATIWFNEVGIFFANPWFHSATCNFASPQNINILLIADPQVTDTHSYSFTRDQDSLLYKLVTHYSDIYMKKNAHVLARQQPDIVIFLGDLFDGGRFLTNEQFATEKQRFWRIFQSLVKLEKRPTLLFTAGNHDVGMKQTPQQISHELVYARFQNAFQTELNYVHPVNHHFDIIVVNSVILEMFHQMGGAQQRDAERAQQFVNRVSKTMNPEKKRILISHVPLYRPNNADCGPYTRTRPLSFGFGFGYQNTLLSPTTTDLLNKIRPTLVFSGDDHEPCEYVHQTLDGVRAVETTVGTFSWLQLSKAQYPNAGFLSLSNVTSDYKYETCMLPPQKLIFYSYIVVFILTMPFLLLVPVWNVLKAALLFNKNTKMEPDEESPLPLSSKQSNNTITLGYSDAPLKSRFEPSPIRKNSAPTPIAPTLRSRFSGQQKLLRHFYPFLITLVVSLSFYGLTIIYWTR